MCVHVCVFVLAFVSVLVGVRVQGEVEILTIKLVEQGTGGGGLSVR